MSDRLTLGVGLPLLVFQKGDVSELGNVTGQLAPCRLFRGAVAEYKTLRSFPRYGLAGMTSRLGRHPLHPRKGL